MIPWRFLVPRRQYFRSLRIARACPEIRAHIDRAAFYTAAENSVFGLFLIPGILVLLIEWCLEKVRHSLPIPNFAEERNRAIEEAHRIVPIAEIRRRVGLPPLPSIMAKPKETNDEP